MTVKDYYEEYWSERGFYPHGQLTPALTTRFESATRAGAKVLDVGCGDGRAAGLWFQSHDCSYIGVDISANAVRDAQALGLDARLIEDASVLPFPDGTFDLVVCIEVFEHLFQPQLAAAEISRVLKPGGVLFATVPNMAYWRRRLDLAMLGRWNPVGDNLSVEQPWRDPHIRFFNRGALRRMLRTSGYASVRVGGHGGGFIRDVPWVGRRLGGGAGTRLYRCLERLAPAVFGYRLDAIAVKRR